MLLALVPPLTPFLTSSHHLTRPLCFFLQVITIGTGSPPLAVSNEGLDALMCPRPFLPKKPPVPQAVSPRASSHEELSPLVAS